MKLKSRDTNCSSDEETANTLIAVSVIAKKLAEKIRKDKENGKNDRVGFNAKFNKRKFRKRTR